MQGYDGVRCVTCGQPRAGPGPGCQRNGYHDRGRDDHRYATQTHRVLTVVAPHVVVDLIDGRRWRFTPTVAGCLAAIAHAADLNANPTASLVAVMTTIRPGETVIMDGRAIGLAHRCDGSFNLVVEVLP